MRLLLALAALCLTSFDVQPLSSSDEGVNLSADRKRDGGKKKDKEEDEEDCRFAVEVPTLPVCPIGSAQSARAIS